MDTVAGGLLVPIYWSPVFGRIFGHRPQWLVDCRCLYPGTLYLAGYLDIWQSDSWTVGACILFSCIWLDIWTLTKVSWGLWLTVSWSPEFGRIFGHLAH